MAKLARLVLASVALVLVGFGVSASVPSDACAREPGGACDSSMEECPCLEPGKCGYSEVA